MATLKGNFTVRFFSLPQILNPWEAIRNRSPWFFSSTPCTGLLQFSKVPQEHLRSPGDQNAQSFRWHLITKTSKREEVHPLLSLPSVLCQIFTGRKTGCGKRCLHFLHLPRRREVILWPLSTSFLRWQILLPNEARIRKDKAKVNPPGEHRTGNATIKVKNLYAHNDNICSSTKKHFWKCHFIWISHSS